MNQIVYLFDIDRVLSDRVEKRLRPRNIWYPIQEALVAERLVTYNNIIFLWLAVLLSVLEMK